MLYQVPAAQLNPYHDQVKLLRHVVRKHREGRALGVGRHGASDAAASSKRGIPCVEFGPTGAGHHGPDEHVEIAPLATYRRILVEFAPGHGRAARGLATARGRSDPRSILISGLPERARAFSRRSLWQPRLRPQRRVTEEVAAGRPARV